MSKEQSLFDINIRIMHIVGKTKMLVNYVFNHKLFTVLKRNNNLIVSDDKANANIYICALGPSLKQVNFNAIKGDTLVVNRFFKFGTSFPKFVPTYYLMLDPLFAKEDNIADFEMALTTYLDKGTIFILNSKMAKLPVMEKYKKNKNIYYISSFNGMLNPYKKYPITSPMPSFQNVVGASIFLLMQMGYKKISLLGCDFNSFASPHKIHCYEEKDNVRTLSLSFELFCYAIASRNHDDLQKYAQINKVNILNSTKGSLIDAYSMEIDSSLYT